MMKKKYTRGLLLAASLFLLPASFQSVLAADLNSKVSSSLDKSSAVTQKAKTTVASEKKKITSTAAVGKISKIDLNSASVEQLTTLNGIGDKTAKAIVDYRKKNGDFTNVKDLVNVKGIGVATLKKVIPYVSL
ncbi:helix-hairpin-helix domain-containing protein [uncultured Psychromonas sp.]|uniref:ComEA family DNA-binding protein n=1 Tax=uncultured Psychromonas sp. TaxID=173974 RepID=UPI0026171184|nr:helix-hairpin-helix domain-containing protein [uncultured Psychromonas sp.]